MAKIKNNTNIEKSKKTLLKEDVKFYQDVQEKNDNIVLDNDLEEKEEHVHSFNELSGIKNQEEELANIKRKCKFKQEYVDNNILLSVNHLKQYFFFGKGPNRYKLKAVHDASFQIKEGECFGVVGESGCGKTTTGRSIIKLYDITSGSIYYKGYRIGAGSRWNQKEIKYTKIRLNKAKKVYRENVSKIKKSIEDEIYLLKGELDLKLDKKEINKEEYKTLIANKRNELEKLHLKEFESLGKAINEEIKKANDIIKVQKAKIQQIKYDNRRAFDLTTNGDAIKETKKEISIYKKKLNKLNRELVSLEKSKNIDKELAKLTENPSKNKEAIEKLKNRPIFAQKRISEINPEIIDIKSKLVNLETNLENLKKTDKRVMSEIQMIFQDPIDSLDPRMTVETIISEGLQIQGLKNKEENHKRVVEVLEKVGLIEDYASRYPHEFSGGQRQRIGIARALIMNPKLLICDEPISALDVSIRAQIINLLNDLKEEMGLTLMFIAHDLSVVKYFCDRIAVMYFGEIVELATSDELFKHPLHPYTKSLLSAIPKPNPLVEKNRKRIIYNPQESHDYSKEKPKLVEIVKGHFILANSEEVKKYKEEIDKIDHLK